MLLQYNPDLCLAYLLCRVPNSFTMGTTVLTGLSNLACLSKLSQILHKEVPDQPIDVKVSSNREKAEGAGSGGG